jgi:hypothetical protein
VRCPANLQRGVLISVLFCEKYHFVCKTRKSEKLFKSLLQVSIEGFLHKKKQPENLIALHSCDPPGVLFYTDYQRYID